MKAVSTVLVVAILELTVIPVGWAEENADDSKQHTAAQFGLGAASVFLTIPYGLSKFLFASLGGIFGGFTYVFSAGNEKAATAVWHTSMRGTYVITPEHLKGDKAIRFFGVPPDSDGETLAPGSQEPAPMIPEPMK